MSVTREIWHAVMARDGGCVLAKLDSEHLCRDRWGNLSTDDMTVEHVKDQPRMGKRAPSDMAHLVAMCYGGNVGVPSKKQRAMLREYLAQKEPA